MTTDPRPYRPANGSEGDSFMDLYCNRCQHDADPDNPCPIPDRTMVYTIDEPAYPPEWVYVDGRPTCTEFARRDDR